MVVIGGPTPIPTQAPMVAPTYMMGQPNMIPPHFPPSSIGTMIPPNIPYANTIPMMEEVDPIEIPMCHLHKKPQLSCKFCRKYKCSIHQQARLALQQTKIPDTNKNTVELTNTSTYNMNHLLRDNIITSEYFKSLYTLKYYNEVVDEIYQYADHAEPYCAGSSRAPSTLFCCLYKMFCLRLGEKQLKSMLDHFDSPYIRCCGFLYLRYAHPPEKLWEWYEPFFLDDEEFSPGADKKRTITMGEYVESLIVEDKYYCTVLPRLPVKIKNQYGAQLITMDEHRKRKALNKSKIDEFVPGIKVDACSNGDWLEGTIISINDRLPGRLSVYVKLEDDSEEFIDIALITIKKEKNRDEKNKHKKHKKHKSSRRSDSEDYDYRSSRRARYSSKSRSRSPGQKAKFSETSGKSQDELLQEFRKREREKAIATGKEYAKRPTSYKSSLSLRADNGVSQRRRSRSISPSRISVIRTRVRSPSPEIQKIKEPSLEHKQKMAQLMERYSKNTVNTSKQHADIEGPDVVRLG